MRVAVLSFFSLAEKDEELQAVMKESFSAQSRVSEEVEEEKQRLRADHERTLDMLDQKYQDEFVDLERHHTVSVLSKGRSRNVLHQERGFHLHRACVLTYQRCARGVRFSAAFYD